MPDCPDVAFDASSILQRGFFISECLDTGRVFLHIDPVKEG